MGSLNPAQEKSVKNNKTGTHATAFDSLFRCSPRCHEGVGASGASDSHDSGLHFDVWDVEEIV